MTPTSKGWVVFLAAVGMMLSMLSVDIMTLMSWDEVLTPIFIGTIFGHLAAVIAAFVGGKLIPPIRDPTMRTRNGE